MSEFAGVLTGETGNWSRFVCIALRCDAKLCERVQRRDSPGWCFKWAVSVLRPCCGRAVAVPPPGFGDLG